jgi:hypothetical protein
VSNLIEIVLHSIGASAVESDLGGVNASLDKLKVTAMQSSAGAAALGGAIGGLVGGMLPTLIEEVGRAGESLLELGPRLADDVEQLRNLGERSGMSINQLRILQGVMREHGLGADSLAFALSMLNRRLGEGNEKLIALIGNTSSPMEALFRLSKIIKEGGNAAVAASDAMGISGQRLIPILRNLDEDYASVRDRLGELSDATILAAEHFKTLENQFQTHMMAMGDSIAGFILRAVEGVRKAPWILALLGLGPLEMLGAASIMGSAVDLGPTGADWHGAAGVEGPPITKSKKGKKSKTAGWSSDDLDMLRETERMQKEAFQQFVRTHGELVTLTNSMIDGITSSIDTIFANLGSKFQTFGSAIKTLFDGIAQSILSALAKIAESKLLIWISGFFLTGSGLGVAQGIGGIIREAGKQLIGANSMSPARGGNTTIIQTLDTRTLRMQMQSPLGSWTRAQSELRIGSVY